jgi:hypothetical protein
MVRPDLKTHYRACAEGVADDLLWVWLQVAMYKLALDTHQSTFLNTAGHDHTE